LAVGVGAVVDRHPIDKDAKVCAMVEIVAPDKVLVRLAVAGVLGDHHAGHGFQ
jgi:hypothetical protein